MTNADEILNIAKDFQFLIILAPLFSFPAYIMDGVFFGSTPTSEMRKAMIFSTLIYFLLEVIWISIFQNIGLWAALYGFLIIRAIALIYYYPNIEQSVSSTKN